MAKSSIHDISLRMFPLESIRCCRGGIVVVGVVIDDAIDSVLLDDGFVAANVTSSFVDGADLLLLASICIEDDGRRRRCRLHRKNSTVRSIK